MKKLILSLVVLFITPTLFAGYLDKPTREARIQGEILLPTQSGIFQNFDGKDFGMSDDAVKTALAAQFGKVEVNQKDRLFQISNERGQYKLNWKNQDFENGLDLRMNQFSYFKKDGKLTMTSNTFNGQYIRSSTMCKGSVVDSGLTDKEVYCATATREVCKRVLAAYRKNDDLRTPKVSFKESKAAADAKVQSCLTTMKGYSEVLKAFSQTYTGNSGLVASHKQIIDQENKEISAMLGDVKAGGSPLKKNYVNSMTGDDFAKAADKLTSTMTGLEQINDFVGLCSDHEEDFAPDAANNYKKGEKGSTQN